MACTVGVVTMEGDTEQPHGSEGLVTIFRTYIHTRARSLSFSIPFSAAHLFSCTGTTFANQFVRSWVLHIIDVFRLAVKCVDVAVLSNMQLWSSTRPTSVSASRLQRALV